MAKASNAAPIIAPTIPPIKAPKFEPLLSPSGPSSILPPVGDNPGGPVLVPVVPNCELHLDVHPFEAARDYPESYGDVLALSRVDGR